MRHIHRLLSALVCLLFSFGALALKAGDVAPNLYGKTLDTKLFRLSQVAQPAVVNFFWVECKPCIKELPELAKLATAHPQVQFIAVHVGDEDQAAVTQFLAHVPAHPSTIVLASPAVKDNYHIRVLPHTVVIHESKITGIVEGYSPTGWLKLLQLVRALPAKP